MERLLEGIRVIDCASFIAAPAAATIMADFGADVIKIEPPTTGDTYRNTPNTPGNPPYEVNYAWIVDNRNKRSVALDLKAKSGRDVLYRLVAETDVFVTNAPLPARERLGIEYETLKEHNPQLIYASLTAYGERGPEADNTGFDTTALWARSSLMDMVRAAPDAPPVRSLPGMGDHPTAVSLYAGIASALLRRERTGEGAYVHTSLLANGAWWNAIQIQAMLSGSEFRRRPAREDASSALHNLYQCADGRWFHLVLIPEEKRWSRFLDAISRPDLDADERFRTSAARALHAKALTQALDDVFRTEPWDTWKHRLDSGGITYGAVATLRDIATDQQMHAADVLTPIKAPGAGADFIVNSPLWVEETPKVPPRLAPEIGEHTAEVLRSLGLPDEALDTLERTGVIAVHRRDSD